MIIWLSKGLWIGGNLYFKQIINSIDWYHNDGLGMFEKFICAANRAEKEENYKNFQRLRTFNDGNIMYYICRFSRYKHKFENWVSALLLLLLYYSWFILNWQVYRLFRIKIYSIK